MATQAQMDALMAVACPWCGVGTNDKCRVRIGTRWLTVPSTLDGECHEARWQAALGIPARVMSSEVDVRMDWTRAPEEEPARFSEPGRVAVLERPW